MEGVKVLLGLPEPIDKTRARKMNFPFYQSRRMPAAFLGHQKKRKDFRSSRYREKPRPVLTTRQLRSAYCLFQQTARTNLPGTRGFNIMVIVHTFGYSKLKLNKTRSASAMQTSLRRCVSVLVNSDFHVRVICLAAYRRGGCSFGGGKFGRSGQRYWKRHASETAGA